MFMRFLAALLLFAIYSTRPMNPPADQIDPKKIEDIFHYKALVDETKKFKEGYKKSNHACNASIAYSNRLIDKYSTNPQEVLPLTDAEKKELQTLREQETSAVHRFISLSQTHFEKVHTITRSMNYCELFINPDYITMPEDEWSRIPYSGETDDPVAQKNPLHFMTPAQYQAHKTEIDKIVTQRTALISDFKNKITILKAILETDETLKARAAEAVTLACQTKSLLDQLKEKTIKNFWVQKLYNPIFSEAFSESKEQTPSSAEKSVQNND